MCSKKVKEAVDRMRMLGIYEPVIEDFKKSQKLYYSETTSLGGILYWVSNEPGWEEKIKDFEKNYSVLVYHVVHCFTSYGEMLYCLYISGDEDEWEYDRADISGNEKCPLAYVINLDYPEYSEFGSVELIPASGGLVPAA